MKEQKALITGITGQDGSYLAEFLLEKGYEVSGTIRKSENLSRSNISHISHRLKLVYADLGDSHSLLQALKDTRPDEIYNLASQSVPATSFREPIDTAEITGIGPHRLLEAMREVCPKAKFYQASTAEMFGWVGEVPQSEETPFHPANPYAAAKLYAHHIAKIYRKSYGMFIACGILYNHSSPRRSLNFVEQKVAYAAACAKLGIDTSEHSNEAGEPIVKNSKVAMGNLELKRDWGFALDYVESMWLMLQQTEPDDYVIGTGEAHTIRELCQETFLHVGLDWGKYVVVDKRFFRPTETGTLIADYAKAKKILGWKPKTSFKQLVAMLVDANIRKLTKSAH